MILDLLHSSLTRVSFALIALPLLSGCVRMDASVSQTSRTVPHFESSGRCPGPDHSPLSDACAFLHNAEVAELQTSPGARIYRETWQGPLWGPMGRGSIVLTILPDGRRILTTPWGHKTYNLKSGDLPDFEATLARSDFGARSPYNRSPAFCVDGVGTALEAIVDDHYRVVYFDYCGGVSSKMIAEALDQFFVFAAAKSGLRYPVNPEHPTYRG